jgi:hypothetical protein
MNRGRYQKGVTAIEDLIDINDNKENNFEESPLGNRINKYIRKSDKGGMFKALRGGEPSIEHEMDNPMQPIDEEPEYQYPVRQRIREHSTHTYQQPILQQPSYQEQHSRPIMCTDIFEHISNCPICSKIYNQDKTIYIFFIVILSIIIIILIKNLFNK